MLEMQKKLAVASQKDWKEHCKQQKASENIEQ
jgi:hypothetical protein